jgi:hypothetical protein
LPTEQQCSAIKAVVITGKQKHRNVCNNFTKEHVEGQLWQTGARISVCSFSFRGSNAGAEQGHRRLEVVVQDCYGVCGKRVAGPQGILVYNSQYVILATFECSRIGGTQVNKLKRREFECAIQEL